MGLLITALVIAGIIALLAWGGAQEYSDMTHCTGMTHYTGINQYTGANRYTEKKDAGTRAFIAAENGIYIWRNELSNADLLSIGAFTAKNILTWLDNRYYPESYRVLEFLRRQREHGR